MFNRIQCRNNLYLLRRLCRRHFIRNDMSEDGVSNWAAVCQMTSTNDVQRNLSIVEELVSAAASKSTAMVFLPECCDYVGDSVEETIKLAETLEGPTMVFLRDLASRKSVWLSLGGFHERLSDTSVAISHVVIDNDGNIRAVYRKTHLFDADLTSGNSYKESGHTTPGDTIASVVETPLGKVGLQVCYDLRFPEVSIAQTRLGAECLTYPSAFTIPTGMAHWHVLLRARAIENQCYVIAAAQTGVHNPKRASYGHGLIVDPWGSVVCECSQGNSFAMAEINLKYLNDIRRKMPVMKHRRYDLYSS